MKSKTVMPVWCKVCDYNPAQVELCGIRKYIFELVRDKKCPREKELKKNGLE